MSCLLRYKHLQTVANNLLLVDAYNPQIGVTAQNNLNTAVLLYESAQSIANSATAAWNSLLGSGSEVVSGAGVFTVGASTIQNKQQAMFQQFYGYWRR